MVQVQEGMSTRCKCASSVKGAYAVLCLFVKCCIIASECASGIVSRVIHVLRVPFFCLHPCFRMHVLRYPCSVRSFQLQKDRFWAWAEDTPQEEEEEEEEDESSSSSSSSNTSSASASASASGGGASPGGNVGVALRGLSLGPATNSPATL